MASWFDKWQKLAGNNRKAVSSYSWKQTAKVDAATGVGAAASIGVAALFGPVGWGVFVGGTLGGAVGGSVTDAILQLW